MPDAESLEELRELVDRLTETTAQLRELGEREDIPAVERNAARLEGVLDQLRQNLPPESFNE